MDELSSPAGGVRKERRLLIGAAVGGALAAAGVAWWRYQAVGAQDAQQPAEAAPELASFWATPWADPAGKPLHVQQYQGNPLLINFWATWCPPCVDELPMLNGFYLQNKAKGWQVLGLAIDRVEMVQRFLHHNPIDFPVAMAGLGGAELGRSLGNLSGGLPFTVVVDSAGAIAQRKLGRVSVDNLQQWAGLK